MQCVEAMRVSESLLGCLSCFRLTMWLLAAVSLMVVVAHGRPGHSQSLRSVISFPSSSKIALDTEAHGVVGVHAHVRDLAATSASLEFRFHKPLEME